MITITKYIANDGTEFDDDTDCLRYEMNLTLINERHVLLYDSDFNILTDSRMIDEAAYIYCLSDEAESIITEMCKFVGVDEPWLCSDNTENVPAPYKGMIYVFDPDNYNWTTVENLVAKGQDLIRRADLIKTEVENHQTMKLSAVDD